MTYNMVWVSRDWCKSSGHIACKIIFFIKKVHFFEKLRTDVIGHINNKFGPVHKILINEFVHLSNLKHRFGSHLKQIFVNFLPVSLLQRKSVFLHFQQFLTKSHLPFQSLNMSMLYCGLV